MSRELPNQTFPMLASPAMASKANPVRIGILGASSYAPTTILGPAGDVEDVDVVAVGARDMPSASEFAARHGLPIAHGSYGDLIADPDIDAVYVLVPTSMHGEWTRAAVDAGKHVLCEKPFTANAAEARAIADLAVRSDRVVMEAIQFRHHPLTLRAQEIIASGELGKLRFVDVALCVLIRDASANCYNYSLAGGAMMDAGSYAVTMLRVFGGSTPEVVSAQAKLRGPDVDRAMTAQVRFGEGHLGRLRCALWSSDLVRASVRVVGERGRLRILSPAAPHLYPRLGVRTADGRRVERFSRRASYVYQLEAFAEAVRRGAPVRTSPEQAVENMTVIDAIYRAAGLPIRMPS